MNSARSSLLYIVFASTLVVALLVPVKAQAADMQMVDEVWDYPTRVLKEIDVWADKLGWNPQQVLGESVTSEKKFRDLTHETIVESVQSQSPDLKNKLNSTDLALDTLYLNYQQMAGEAVLMGLKWDSLTVTDVRDSIDKLNVLLSNASQLDWLAKAWGWPQLDIIAAKSNLIKTNLITANSILNTSGMQPVAYEQIRAASQNLEAIVYIIGEKTDAPTKPSVYGAFGQVKSRVAKLDILENRIQAGETEVKDELLSLNQIPGGAQMESSASDMLALIQANRDMLAYNRGTAFATTWMTDNPVQFKTLITNPSVLARQIVKVKYYLPSELEQDDISKSDVGLNVQFDTDKQRLYIEGEMTVAASDSRILVVETKDVWKYDQTQIDAVRVQMGELLKPLVDTPKFVKGVEIKGQIEANLKSIEDSQLVSVLPQERIHVYRINMVKLNEAEDKLSELRRLVKGGFDIAGFVKGFNHFRELGIIVLGLIFVGVGTVGLSQVSGKGPKQMAAKPRPVYQFNVFSADVEASDL